LISFLCLRGNLVVEYPIASMNGKRGRPQVHWRSVGSKEKKGKLRGGEKRQPNSSSGQSQSGRRKAASLGKAAWERLLFPIAYLIVIAPLSAVRLKEWIDLTWDSPVATAIAGALFNSSGLVNVLLYLYTRPSLLRGILGRDRSNATSHDMEGSASPNPAGAGGRFKAAQAAIATLPEMPVKDTVDSSDEEYASDQPPDTSYGPSRGHSYNYGLPPDNANDYGSPEGYGHAKPVPLVSPRRRDYLDPRAEEYEMRASGSSQGSTPEGVYSPPSPSQPLTAHGQRSPRY